MQCSISPSVVKLPDEVLCFRPEEMYMMNWLVWHLPTPAVRKLVTKHNPHKEVWLPSNKFPKFCFSLALHGKKVTKKKNPKMLSASCSFKCSKGADREQTWSRHGFHWQQQSAVPTNRTASAALSPGHQLLPCTPSLLLSSSQLWSSSTEEPETHMPAGHRIMTQLRKKSLCPKRGSDSWF